MLKSKKIYLAFNKPYGILSQFTPNIGDDSLKQFNFPSNVYPAGRLDKDSEGLLILTNDGEFIHQLLNPKFEKEKTYWAQVDGIPSEASLEKLRSGIMIENYQTKPAKIMLLPNTFALPARNPPIRVRKSIPTSWLELTITEGKNRQVRKMTAAIGHPTLRLIRVKIGDLELGDLGLGEYKIITKEDLFNRH